MGFSEYFEEEIELLEMKIDNLQEENKRLVGLALDKDEQIERLKVKIGRLEGACELLKDMNSELEDDLVTYRNRFGDTHD